VSSLFMKGLPHVGSPSRWAVTGIPPSIAPPLGSSFDRLAIVWNPWIG
jgi:hypothetical protein